MFLLLSMTFLELAAFLIIICIIINAWDKWNSKYKLAAIISLLVTGVFFINDLTIMASVNPTETTTQKIVISPKEQNLKKQLEINLYPHNNFYFTEKVTLKPQSRLSIDDYRLIKNSFSKDSTMNAQLNIIPKTDNSLKYRDNQFFQNTNISQDMSLFEKNIHLNNPKKSILKTQH